MEEKVNNSDLYVAFIHFKKANDSLPRNKLWAAMVNMKKDSNF